MYKKDHFKVTGAILLGMQNYWGERKMYIKCMAKIGSLMLYNLSKVDILQFLSKLYYEVKIPSKSCCQLNVKGSHSLKSEKSYF